MAKKILDLIKIVADRDKRFWNGVIAPYRYVANTLFRSGFYKWVADICDLKKGDSLIDVGCGTGTFLLTAVPKIHYGIGIDIAPNAVKLSKEALQKSGIPVLGESALKDPKEIPMHSAVLMETPLHELSKNIDFVDKATIINLSAGEGRLPPGMVEDITWENISMASRHLRDNGLVFYVTNHFSEEDIGAMLDGIEGDVETINREIAEDGLHLEIAGTEKMDNTGALGKLRKAKIKTISKAYTDAEKLIHAMIIFKKKA